MKIIKSNSYKHLKFSGFNSRQIDQVASLVKKGLSVETAVEQIFGIKRLNRAEMQKVKEELINRRGPRIPIISF